MKKPRYSAIDAARGLALIYMVLWHTLHWMSPGVALDRTPFSFDWIMGLILKPAPTLFIMCFGCMLGALVIPRSRPLREECRHLWRRALLILVCYKLLFLLELWANGRSPQEMVEAMLWRRLSGCVEIMDFYFINLMLAPFVFWLWRRSHLVHKLAAVAGLWWLTAQWQAVLWPDNLAIAQALLVGRPDFYPFSLLPWAGTVMLGLLLGEHWVALAATGRKGVIGACCTIAVALFIVYLALTPDMTMAMFTDKIVFLGWKHPPRVPYVALGTAYSFALLALFVAVMGPDKRVPGRNVLEVMGRHPLSLYNFHWTMLLMGVAAGWYRQFQPSWGYLMAVGLCCLCAGLAYFEEWRGQVSQPT